MPKRKKKLKAKTSLRRSHAFVDKPAKVKFRERRLRDIKPVERYPFPEARKYSDTLPLPFGGEVKKDAMREHGLIH